MNIHRITYNPKTNSSSLYFIGCNFRCIACYWKQIYPRVNFSQLRFLSLEEVISVLKPVAPGTVTIISGDPVENEEFSILPRVLHDEFGCEVRIMTNGHILPSVDGLDHAVFSIKALSNNLHKIYTGKTNEHSLKHFRYLHESGVGLSCSSVYIPELIEKDEIARISEFIKDIDPSIPYRIIGYMPVNGLPYRRPTYDEVEQVAVSLNGNLKNICFSSPSPHDYTGIVDLFTNNLRR